MGSKKLKKKKLKVKKLEICNKIKANRRKKSILFGSAKIAGRKDNSGGKKITNNRSSPKKRSRSGEWEKDGSNLKYFSKVRDDYFSHLQNVLSDNCKLCGSVVAEDVLESLALELEQSALLACLQVDIYKMSMLKIIKDITNSTEEKQVHKDVKRILPQSQQRKTDLVNTERSAEISSEIETYSQIPTVTITRTDDNVMNNKSLWTEESGYISEQYYSLLDHCPQTYCESQNDLMSSNVYSCGEGETCSSMFNPTSYWNNEMSLKNCNYKNSLNSNASQPFNLDNNFTELNAKPIDFAESEENSEKVDSLLESRNQLQKVVEQTLNESEKINKQKQDEQERAYIAQILEGDDSLDDKLNDSLSDNENDSKENIDESNLLDRLEKMREIFGLEEERTQTGVVPEKQKRSNRTNPTNIRNRRPTIWKYEKFIQLHKYSIIAAEMTFERRSFNRKCFIELFGEDSDEEHEAEYSSTEKYRSSCTERISSWVVKYLMPFYHEKRILGRKVFKSLGHYISDTIVDEIQYPDEWTVKYFVSKFFPPKKKYVCDADVLNFQLE